MAIAQIISFWREKKLTHKVKIKEGGAHILPSKAEMPRWFSLAVLSQLNIKLTNLSYLDKFTVLGDP